MSIDQDRANSGAPVAAPTVAVPGAGVAAESSPSPEASPGPSSPASAAAGSGWVEYGPRRRGGNIDRNSVPNSTAALPQYLAAIPAETTRRQMQLVRTIKVEYPHSGKACGNCNSGFFFWTFRKKLKAKKTQAEKKLKRIFEKLKQIIQKLNNLPT